MESLIYSLWNLIPNRIVYPSLTWAWHSSAPACFDFFSNLFVFKLLSFRYWSLFRLIFTSFLLVTVLFQSFFLLKSHMTLQTKNQQPGMLKQKNAPKLPFCFQKYYKTYLVWCGGESIRQQLPSTHPPSPAIQNGFQFQPLNL